MLALLAAATVATAPGAASIASETPNRFVLPEHCKQFYQTNRPAYPIAEGRKLTELPPADMHLLVDRKVAGCPVPTIVRHNVDGPPRPLTPPRREGAPARKR
jgi:hypothetical protein